MKALVTTKGQVTIPKLIRDQIHILPGTKIDFTVEDGYLIGRPVVKKLSSLKGIVRKKRKSPVTLKEMNDVIRKRGSGK